MSKDDKGRISGYGIHGDRRTRRNRTKNSTLEAELFCDICGKRNAKQASNWQLLCLECRQAADDDGYDD